MREKIKQRLKDNIEKAQKIQQEYSNAMEDAIKAGIDPEELQNEITKELIGEQNKSQ